MFLTNNPTELGRIERRSCNEKDGLIKSRNLQKARLIDVVNFTYFAIRFRDDKIIRRSFSLRQHADGIFIRLNEAS